MDSTSRPYRRPKLCCLWTGSLLSMDGFTNDGVLVLVLSLPGPSVGLSHDCQAEEPRPSKEGARARQEGAVSTTTTNSHSCCWDGYNRGNDDGG